MSTTMAPAYKGGHMHLVAVIFKRIFGDSLRKVLPMRLLGSDGGVRRHEDERDNQNICQCPVRWRKGRQASRHFIDIRSRAVRQTVMDDQTLGLAAEQPDAS